MTIPAAPNPSRIGLLAGWGRFPITVAMALKQAGHAVYCLGVKDHADPVLASICDGFQPVGVARLGASIRFFRRHGVERATMAGKIHKVLMFQRLAWLKHFPDWRFIRAFYPHWVTGSRDRKDDSLLNTLVNAYAEEGIMFVPATDYAPELLIQEGHLGGPGLSAAARRDIEFGWQLAKEMGRLDVGQSVAVKGQAVLAVEAIEGTDACIRRAGELCKAGGFTVVKVAKPQQDMRFDVPTIGVGTLEVMAAAGGKVLAIEAHKTIVLDQADVVRFAARHGITLLAIRDGRVAA